MEAGRRAKPGRVPGGPSGPRGGEVLNKTPPGGRNPDGLTGMSKDIVQWGNAQPETWLVMRKGLKEIRLPFVVITEGSGPEMPG